MDYTVVVVDDDQLAGQDWLLIERANGVVFAVTSSASERPGVYAEGWAAYRMLERSRQRASLRQTA